MAFSENELRLFERPEGNETRIIIINTPEAILAAHFQGLVVDGNGTLKVGNLQISPKEAGPALSRMVIFTTDMARKDESITDPEAYCQKLYTDPNLLSFRTTIFEVIVEDMRNHPGEELR
jgi:hypothetical protein